MRIFVRAGTAWFAARDVCDALGLSDVSAALRDIPAHCKMSMASSGGRRLIMINGLGLGCLACRPEFSRVLRLAADKSAELAKQPKAVSAPDDGFFSVAEYADKQGVIFVNAEASKIGKLATQISRQRGLPIHRHKHSLFGAINAYSEEALSSALEEIYADEA